MAKSLERLQGDYEDALAASQDDPEDEKKATAANKAGKALTDARTEARIGRGGVGVVATDDGEDD
jgi:hypothetical protein